MTAYVLGQLGSWIVTLTQRGGLHSSFSLITCSVMDRFPWIQTDLGLNFSAFHSLVFPRLPFSFPCCLLQLWQLISSTHWVYCQGVYNFHQMSSALILRDLPVF